MSLSRTSKDVLSGTSGGIAQVFVGQPLDIIKVRLQTAPQGTYSGLVDCAKQIFTAEGALGFYRVSVAIVLHKMSIKNLILLSGLCTGYFDAATWSRSLRLYSIWSCRSYQALFRWCQSPKGNPG